MTTGGRGRHRLRAFVRTHWSALLRSYGSSLASRAFPLPGRAFEAFGRRLGRKAVVAGDALGEELLLRPVSSTRYWEFPFVWEHLPRPPGTCLDVGSPRLFSLFVADRYPSARIRILNPDARDAVKTERAARLIGAANVRIDRLPVDALAESADRYDIIWSISVIEHIPNDGDIRAMRVMYEALAPGGTLLLTIPVDQSTWIEYRPTDTYQLGLPREPQGYFFQRWYDLPAVQARLLDPLGISATLEWFGETAPGRFAAYIARWLSDGPAVTLADPYEFGRHYRTFPNWDAMPATGVCGISITKPLGARP
jgi:SAM-dependent methyltransferase